MNVSLPILRSTDNFSLLTSGDFEPGTCFVKETRSGGPRSWNVLILLDLSSIEEPAISSFTLSPIVSYLNSPNFLARLMFLRGILTRELTLGK